MCECRVRLQLRTLLASPSQRGARCSQATFVACQEPRPAAAVALPPCPQPLLKRWQAGGLSYAAFALPAVQAVIGEPLGLVDVCVLRSRTIEQAVFG